MNEWMEMSSILNENTTRVGEMEWKNEEEEGYVS